MWWSRSRSRQAAWLSSLVWPEARTSESHSCQLYDASVELRARRALLTA